MSASPGLILHEGNEGDCLYAPWLLIWCSWNAPVQICNFIIGCPLPRRKCLGALALSKTKHTALWMINCILSIFSFTIRPLYWSKWFFHIHWCRKEILNTRKSAEKSQNEVTHAFFTVLFLDFSHRRVQLYFKNDFHTQLKKKGQQNQTSHFKTITTHFTRIDWYPHLYSSH